MLRFIVISIFMLSCGCVAIVDNTGDERKMHVYGTTEAEIEDTLTQGENKTSDEKTEIIIIKN